jgi:hypothetical protein
MVVVERGGGGGRGGGGECKAMAVKSGVELGFVKGDGDEGIRM